jgi:rubrerythrin
MAKSNALNILKNAIFMERQGKHLYETARDKADDRAVKDFFQELANEETDHIAILEMQFKAFKETGQFVHGRYDADGEAGQAPQILNAAVKEKINAAGFEATAITAAIGFEERAVELYGLRAQEAEDPEEKSLYTWLADWERTHLKQLLALQESLMEKIWEDNAFWPF